MYSTCVRGVFVCDEIVQSDVQTASLLTEWRRGFLKIPVSSRELGVVCGGWNKMRMCQACRGAFCETCCEMGWLLRRRADVQHFPIMSSVWLESHARTFVWRVMSSAEQTGLGKLCVRRGVLSSHTPSLTRESLLSASETPCKNLRMRKNLAKWRSHRFCKESVSSLHSFSTHVISSLVIWSLGILMFTSLRVLMSVLPPISRRWWRRRRLREISTPTLTHSF